MAWIVFGGKNITDWRKTHCEIGNFDHNEPRILFATTGTKGCSEGLTFLKTERVAVMSGFQQLRRAGVLVAVGVLFLSRIGGPLPKAQAAIVVDAAFTNINQIKSATNNPYFGAGFTLNAAAFNITDDSLATANGGGTLNGITFQDVVLSAALSSTGNTVNARLSGVTADYSFPEGGSSYIRDMTTAGIAPGHGSNWQTAANVAGSDTYFNSGAGNVDTLTLHGLAPNDPVYIQIARRPGWLG